MRTKNRKKRYTTSNKGRVSKESAPNGNPQSIVYGVLPVLELIRSGSRRIDRIFISKGVREAKVAEIESVASQFKLTVDRVSKEEFAAHFRNAENHQGVAAFAALPAYYDSEKLISEIVSKMGSLCIILDGVEDPRNFGAILRTAETVGVDGVFVQERRAAGITETVVKASAGATEYVKIGKVKNINRLIDELKENGVWVVGSSGSAKMDFTEWDWKESSALVLGSEGKGLNRLTAEKCDVLVKIPMAGRIDSLNVSVAAGVLLFEALKQKGES